MALSPHKRIINSNNFSPWTAHLARLGFGRVDGGGVA
jgi:hypothetical protein